MGFDLLITAITSGSLTGIVTWLFSRKKRNNDFLSELQNSIEILSKNYTTTLNRLVDIQSQNAQLLDAQSSMRIQIANLEKENCILLEKLQRTIKELDLVKKQNVELITGQAAMHDQIESLKRENNSLIEKINGLIKQTNQ
jgi:chromosome segregation ATPase